MTVNPPAVTEPDSFTVRRTIRIAAPVEKVWLAVTDPEHISRWFGTVRLHGRDGTISWPDRAPIPLRVEAVDPLRSVSYRWNNDDARGASPAAIDVATSTVFTFTLESVDGETRLTVVESGFDATSDPAANLRSHARGWTAELDELVELLEGLAR